MGSVRIPQQGSQDCAGSGSQAWFTTTQWTLVLTAAGDESNLRAQALNQLCRVYWAPIYGFIRRMGYEPHDAQDLTQSFWLHLLERNTLQKVEPSLGKFRSFLLASVKLFLKNNRDYHSAQKRGGHVKLMSFDSVTTEFMEDQFQLAEDPGLTAEHSYDQRWAIALMNNAFGRLELELRAAGKTQLLQALKPFLSRIGNAEEYAATGLSLGLSAGAVATSVYRLRKRYGDLVREEIARTVPAMSDVEEELRYCLSVLEK
jgi:DNA-directed RNA polymerase specialized sigma24 family protein